MDLTAKIQDFSLTYKALLDLGKNRLPFYQGTKDTRINLLVEKGYLVPGTTRVYCLAEDSAAKKKIRKSRKQSN